MTPIRGPAFRVASLALVALFASGPARPAPRSRPPAPDSSAKTSVGKQLEAPLPRPLFKTHFNSGSGKYVFRDRGWDLAQIRKSFNAVIVDYGKPDLVAAARAAGLAVLVEFDEKERFARGASVAPTVLAIIRQVREHKGTIAGIRVADRLNEKLSPDRALAYLEQTGGVFHREIPGVPVFVDVEDWELTCGLEGQTSCSAHTFDQYRYCTNDVLRKLYRSGNVDGFELAVNLKNDDAQAMLTAMRSARQLFPPPFLICSRSAELSFDGDRYPGDAATAERQVAAFIDAPLRAGADGIDLWAWHRPWKNELRTFMNKGGSSNPLWDRMVAAYASDTSAAGAGGLAPGTALHK